MSASLDATRLDAAQFEGLVTRARAERSPGSIAEAIPYARFLGLGVELTDEGELVGVLRYSDALIGNALLRALHGGTIATLLEWTAAFAVLWGSELSSWPSVISTTTDYLRSGQAMDARCRATIVRRGRRVVVVSVRAFQDDPERPIATAVVHVQVAPDAP